MTYKYICRGILNPGKKGKISWFHDECAMKFNVSGAGGDAIKTEDVPPSGTRCVWCGKRIIDEG